MNISNRRKTTFLVSCGLFVLDLLLYVIALYRTLRIDPTSAEFYVYVFGGILFAILALILAAFGTGWTRTTVMLGTLILAYLWISYIGIEVMKH